MPTTVKLNDGNEVFKQNFSAYCFIWPLVWHATDTSHSIWHWHCLVRPWCDRICRTSPRVWVRPYRYRRQSVPLRLCAYQSHTDASARACLVYGNEDSVGVAIHESALSREELYITTKYDGGDIQEAIRTSLNKVRSPVDKFLPLGFRLKHYIFS